MRQWTVDAFSSRPFGGNTACVVEPLPAWPEAGWMQALARENNAGATAFLVEGERPGHLSIRWFTRDVEVPLCGHATLAAAHVLLKEVGLEEDGLTFESPAGALSVVRDGDGYTMSFPAQSSERVATPPGLVEALGCSPLETWSGAYLVALYETSEEIRGIRPQLDLLRACSLGCGGQGNVGVAALADQGSPYDVIDRFFAPGYGLEEDAATGSFHCLLMPIFAAKLNVQRLRFHQASPGRGAYLNCTLDDDRVLLSGEAVTVAESVLRLAPPPTERLSRPEDQAQPGLTASDAV